MSSTLLKIQQGYFEIVKKYFGHFFDEAKKNNVSPAAIAKDILSQPKFKKLIEENVDLTFGEEIKSYWKENFPPLLEEIKKLNGLRLYYGGDISPYDTGIVNRMGLYADTVIIPDPALKMLNKELLGVMKEHRFFYLLKHTINLMKYEPVIFAKIPQPVVLIFPSDILFQDKGLQEIAIKIQRDKTVEYLNENLFEKQGTFQDWMDYFRKLKNLEDVKKILINKDAFLFDSDIESSGLDEQFESLKRVTKFHHIFEAYDFSNELELIPYSISGRMGQSSWHLIKSEILKSFPIQDAYVSWHYLKWRMQNEKRMPAQSVVPSYLLEKEFKFLGNVPLDILKQLREKGEMQELRNCIGKEVVAGSSEEATEEGIKQIKYNLDQALIEHQGKVEELDKKFRESLRVDIPSLLINGGLSILGVIGNPWLALPTSILGGASLTDIVSKFDEKKKAEQGFKNSFWGFYASAKNE
jgi:hypothetical protein